MRTNIELDEVLIDEASRLSGLKSKRDTVDAALREFVARQRKQLIIDLAGQPLIDPAYDVRAVREAMSTAGDAG